jgi:diacylglycerol kinase family enzyme
MPRPCFLIVNPTSGSYSTATVQRIVSALTAAGFVPELLPTGCAEDATLFAERICAQTRDPLIVVAGGDGTLNGVLNGLKPGAATLAVIPLGTSNVLARELKIRSMDDALKRIAAGNARSISAGELCCGDQKRRFLLMAGVGLDGAVVRGVRLDEKRRFGKFAYLMSALRLVHPWDRGLLQVRCGADSVACHSVIVCKAARYAGNFLLAPEIDLFTPGFRVVCLNGGPLSYLKFFLLLAAGRLGASRSLHCFTASELEVAGGKAVQVDGDYFGCGSLSFAVIPDVARLLM